MISQFYMSLFGSSGSPGVNQLRTMLTNTPNQPLNLQISQHFTSNRSIDTQPINKDTGSDEFGGGNPLHEFIGDVLIDCYGVVGFFLGFSLGPFLLLLFTCLVLWGWCCCFCLNVINNQCCERLDTIFILWSIQWLGDWEQWMDGWMN